jgi:hypothetical protein
MINQTARLFYPAKHADTHRIGDWVDPRAGAGVWRTISSPAAANRTLDRPPQPSRPDGVTGAQFLMLDEGQVQTPGNSKNVRFLRHHKVQIPALCGFKSSETCHCVIV